MSDNRKDNSYRIRAGVINSALEVEDALTLVLGGFYNPTASFHDLFINRLVADVLSDLTFDKKIKLFTGFVNEFDSSLRGVSQILNKIREIRNQLAHRTYYDSREMELLFELVEPKSEDDKFIFEKIGKPGFTFTLDDLREYQEMCHDVTNQIYIVANEIIKYLNSDKK